MNLNCKKRTFQMSGQFEFHPVGSDPKSYHTASATGTDCSVLSNNDVGIALTVSYLAFGEKYISRLHKWPHCSIFYICLLLRWQNLYSRALWCHRKQDRLGFHLQRLGIQKLQNKEDRIKIGIPRR